MDENPVFTGSEIGSDITHLVHLLDIAVEHIIEHVDVMPDDIKLRKQIDRVSALLWVARDMAEKAESDLDEYIKETSKLIREAR